MRRGGKRGGGMAMMRQAVTNGDKSISREEFDSAITAQFARVDTDNSGSITAEEREAAKAEMRAKMRGQRGQRRGPPAGGAPEGQSSL